MFRNGQAHQTAMPRSCGSWVVCLPDARRQGWCTAWCRARQLQARRADKGSGGGPQGGECSGPSRQGDNRMMDARDEPTTGHKSVEIPEKMPERARRALEQVLTFRSTSAIEVYETLREALAGDPGDA